MEAFNIMQTAALAEKMKYSKPDIYLRPDIQGVRIFDFGKLDEVFRQAAPAASRLRRQLKELALTK